MLVSGLMSGSSLDGVDLALCSFVQSGDAWEYKLLASETRPYPEKLRKILVQASDTSMSEAVDADLLLGQHYGSLLNTFHKRLRMRPNLIGSHGHTFFHRPELGLTFQAGNGSVMAAETGIPVVSDFRREDVAQGGQGAPLVPVGDRLLFGEYDACVNLGGFANISFDNEEGKRIAYDTGPANLGLNFLAGMADMEYDRDGQLAARGSIHPGLLDALNRLAYFHAPFPKSLGKEWFNAHPLPLIDNPGIPLGDRLATLSEHIACQVGRAIVHTGAKRVLLTGGGALNKHLVSRIRKHCQAHIHIPDDQLIMYKEALIFAFLAYLRWRGEVNCLSSVTGGSRDLSAGIIHQP